MSLEKSRMNEFNWINIFTLIVIILFINLPLASAVSISDVQVKEITTSSGVVTWETDESADSFVDYGSDKENLKTIGDANKLTKHQILVSDLNPQTTYYYSVESNNVKDNNAGSLYSFETLAPDVTAPELVVKLPGIIPGTKLDVYGKTEIGAKVILKVNGVQAGSVTAEEKEAAYESANVGVGETIDTTGQDDIIETDEMTALGDINETDVVVETNETTEVENITNTEEMITPNGTINLTDYTSTGQAWSGLAVSEGEVEASQLLGSFEFLGVSLTKDKDNNITIEASDEAGNMATFTGTVFADSSKPQLSLGTIPDFVNTNSFPLVGNISENSSYEIFVNNQSTAEGEGEKINSTISLEEGENKVKVVVKDVAGWEVVQEFIIKTDTQAPTVKIELEKGNEFYQGRAETNVHGETEPGATVYLYVYEPLRYDSSPTFDDAWMKTTADQNGSFMFKDVDFEHRPISLKKMGPKLVPSGLESYSLFAVEQLAQQQRSTKQLFVIAEDKSGKSGYVQESITLNTCYGADWAFDVESITQFQAPLRLDADMLDQGQQIITAVFNFSYRGDARAKYDLGTGREMQAAYEVVDVQFEEACTQGMMEDKKFKLGCQIFPQRPSKSMPNGDNTAWYISYNLQSAEKLSETKEDFWNEFKKRRLIFPMKIRINYRERDAQGNLGATKTQASCYDLSYFVDIPLDSKEFLPDWLADEGLEAIKWTIDKLETAEEYLEMAIIVTGVATIAAFIAKMIVRYIRIVVAKFEVYAGIGKGEGEKCPETHDTLLMESTIESWKDTGDLLKQTGSEPKQKGWDKTDYKTLDDLCPSTAGMWKTEAILDQAVRWTWDRVFCRAVPAGWTSDKKWNEVETVKKAQQQCAATSKGIPLRQVENCQDKIKQDVVMTPSARALKLKKEGAFPCYLNTLNNQLYYISEPAKGELGEPKVVTLEWLAPFGGLGLSGTSNAFEVQGEDLIAYKPRDSKDIIVGTDRSCATTCGNERNPGYVPDTEFGDKKGCYKEVREGTGKVNYEGKGGQKISGARYAAGYTKDCFVNVNKAGKEIKPSGDDTGLLQCVCKGDKDNEITSLGARTAAREENSKAEEWVYRQHSIYKKRTGQGTYYPEWRYYSGRDMSSAFGADHLLDYIGDKKYHEVNPFTQHIGAFQTICLSGIRARLVALKNILIGISACIEEAKITGLRDAGVCKSIFAQQVCGLIYKAIAYLVTDCTPTSVKDQGEKGTFDDIAAGSKIIFGSVTEAMQGSIDDVMDDYGGNAALQQYFGTGAKGFSESICMAAFGYDWPMGVDFILDSAYSFPMKTTAYAVPAERELITYNPATGSAVYNYNIGALVLPGCSVRNVNTYLKCVGPEDLIHDDVFCGDQGCDCIQATEISSSLEGEKMRRLEAGRLNNLKPHSFVDLEIKSPQQIDSHYRYDHVVIDVKLGPHESPDNCFDEGHKDGKFYIPITDVSAPGAFTCTVNPLSGRYTCPAIMSMFGGKSGAYFEDPYLSCYDKYSDSYVSCKTPNLFEKGDPIRVKLHLVTDGKKYCIQKSVSGTGRMQPSSSPVSIPEGIDGARSLPLNLGTVGDDSSTGTSVLSIGAESDPGCNQNPQTLNPLPSGQRFDKVVFSYTKLTNGQYTVVIPQGVTVSSGQAVNNGVLGPISGTDLLNVEFDIAGGKFKNLIGNPRGEKISCVYKITPTTGYTANQASIRFSAKLLEPDQMGLCGSATIPLRSSAFGKSQIDQTIILQRQDAVSQVATKLHQEFMKENHGFVMQEAGNIIRKKHNTIEDALAIYYLVADIIVQKKGNWKTMKDSLCNYLTIFFKREYIVDSTKGTPYPEKVTKTVEYGKIHKYLTEINGQLSCVI